MERQKKKRIISKEIVREDSRIIIAIASFISLAGRTIKDLKALLHILIDLHNGRHVPTPVAVVRRRPDRDQRLIEHPPEPVELELVGPAHEVQLIGRQEALHRLRSKKVSRPARRLFEPVDGVWIRPQEVRHRPLLRHLVLPVERAYLVQGGEGRGKAAVHAEHRVLDDGAYGELVEHLCHALPDVGAPVLLDALVVAPVHLGDLAALVVPTE